MATPGSLTLVSGANQDCVINNYFLQTIRVLAKDTTGAIMVNEPIVFGLPVDSSQPGGVFAWTGTRTCQSFTDANGIAESQQIYSNTHIGIWVGLAQFVNALGINAGYGGMANLSDVPYGYLMSSVSGNNQKTAKNTAFASPMVVSCADQFGKAWPNGSVKFLAPSGTGTWASTGTNQCTVNTDANGNATSPVFTASATVGAFTVTASTQSYPHADQSVSFTWTTIDPAVATTLAIVSGGGQQTPPSTAFLAALVARVSNGLGQAMSGVNVTFTAPGSGASCTFVGAAISQVVATGGGGNATSAIPTANATLGAYNVVASSPGLSSVTFKLTNGLNYLPEVCTAVTAPISAVNADTGKAWTGLANSYNGNATGATCTTVDGESTQWLFVAPLPAALLAGIHDQAKITKVTLTYDARGTRAVGATYWSSLQNNLRNNAGNTKKAGGSTGMADAFQSYTVNYLPNYGGTGLTGAQMKNEGIGVTFEVNFVSGMFGSVWVRYVKLQVCYQNPDLPPDPTKFSNPLIYCEA